MDAAIPKHCRQFSFCDLMSVDAGVWPQLNFLREMRPWCEKGCTPMPYLNCSFGKYHQIININIRIFFYEMWSPALDNVILFETTSKFLSKGIVQVCSWWRHWSVTSFYRKCVQVLFKMMCHPTRGGNRFESVLKIEFQTRVDDEKGYTAGRQPEEIRPL